MHSMVSSRWMTLALVSKCIHAFEGEVDAAVLRGSRSEKYFLLCDEPL
jgi:hypothetical protein